MKKLALVLGLLVSGSAFANLHVYSCDVTAYKVDVHGNETLAGKLPVNAIVDDFGDQIYVQINNDLYKSPPMDDIGNNTMSSYDNVKQAYFYKYPSGFKIQSNIGSDDVSLHMDNCRE